MKQVIVHNQDSTQDKPVRAVYCDSFTCRLRGLTFRRKLGLEQGLLLVQSRDSRMDASIHMLGVFIDLAIIWINNSGKVVDTCLARRWRLAYVPKHPARFILEIHPDRLNDFSVGDQVHFEDFAPV
jgi:uncharacterized membrane protein (UPF0127 family)